MINIKIIQCSPKNTGSIFLFNIILGLINKNKYIFYKKSYENNSNDTPNSIINNQFVI